MYKFCAVGMGEGGNKDPKKRGGKQNEANETKPQCGGAQGMPNCTTSSSFASTRICERALKA